MSRAQLTSTVEQNTGGAVAPVSGGKNFAANGNFDFWQRGSSFTSNGNYSSDRWYIFDGTGYTVSPESTTIQDGSTYSYKITQSSSGYCNIRQALESGMVNALAGKTVTFSMYIRANSTFNAQVQIGILTNTSADTITGGTWTAQATNTVTPSTSGWTKASVTYAVPSGTKGLAIQVAYTAVVPSGSITYYSQAQLEVGSIATPFSRAGGTLQGELALCNYYFRVFGAGCIGINEASTALDYSFTFDGGGMRTAPALTLFSTSANNFNWGVGTTAYTITSITGNTVTNKGGYISLNTSNSGISTAGKVVTLLTNNFAASAEL